MKKIYSLLLMAVLLGFFKASAFDCHVSWDVPGTVTLKAGGYTTSYPAIEIPEGATEYNYSGDKNLYVLANEGYLIKTATKSDGNQITPSYSTWGWTGHYVLINQYQEATDDVTITTTSAEENDVLTINVVNGAGEFNAKLTTTGKLLDLSNGTNTIKYNSALDRELWIQKKGYTDADFQYVKVGDEEVEFKSFKYLISLPCTETITIKRNEGEEIEEKVQCNFTLETSEDCVNSIKDITSIPYIDLTAPFTKTAGTQVQINLNVDYNYPSITRNGTDITSQLEGKEIIERIYDAKGENLIEERPTGRYEYRYLKLTLENESEAIAITATPYEYRQITYTARLTNPQGIIFKNAGKVIEPVATETAGTYTITVTEKNPTVTIEPAEGYFIASTGPSSLRDDLFVNESTPEFSIIAQEIVNTASYLVYYHYEQGAVEPTLTTRTSNGNNERKELKQGLNVIPYCPGYDDVNVKVAYYGMSEDNVNSAQCFFNGISQATHYKDGSGMDVYATPLTIRDGYYLELYGNCTRGQYTVNGSSFDRTSKVTVNDATFALTENGSVLDEGTLLTLVPRKDAQATVNGTPVELTDGKALLALNADTEIVFTYAGNDNVAEINPGNGETVEEINGFVITFPKAETAEFIGNADEIIFVSTDNNWAPAGINPISVTPVEGSSNSFKIESTQYPTASKAYRLLVEAGLFLIDGDLPSASAEVTVILKKTFTELPVTLMPEAVSVATSWSPQLTVAFCDFDFNTYEMSNEQMISAFDKDNTGLTLTFNDEAVTDYTVDVEGCMLMIGTNGLGNQGGEMKLNIAAGSFNVGGQPVPALSYTWKFVAPKEYTHSFGKSVYEGNTFLQLNEIHIVIEAETAEVNDAFRHVSIKPEKGSYSETRNALLVKRETANEPQRAAAEGPVTHTFVATFDDPHTQDGDYVLTLHHSSLTLDGLFQYPADYTDAVHNVKLDATAGVGTIVIGDNSPVTVVSLDGRVLLKNAAREELKTLAPGLYLINGKKQAIR